VITEQINDDDDDDDENAITKTEGGFCSSTRLKWEQYWKLNAVALSGTAQVHCKLCNLCKN